MIDAALAYFVADPLKILYFLGGAGGVWFWLEKWLDRIRLRVRVTDHFFDVTSQGLRVTIEFEIVNIGKSPTSLQPFVSCVGHSPKREVNRAVFRFADPDRSLLPHATKSLKAIGDTDATYPWWLFKSYRLSPTRGGDRVVCCRSNPRETISRVRHDVELSIFRWFGWLPFIEAKRSDG